MGILYLDHCATTPCHKEVMEVMLKYFNSEFGNPSSLHFYGKKALHAVNNASRQVAEIIGAHTEEITFTSGATESNNLFLLGLYEWLNRVNGNIILCPIDHKSTLEVGKELQRRGIDVRYGRVDAKGQIDINFLMDLIDQNTKLLSISLVNSELGVIQDIKTLSSICNAKNILLHVDAVQAIGKIPVDVKKMKVDALSLSGHKIYGPKGIGALFIDRSVKHLVKPLMFGGGQDVLRSGTLPTPLIVGLGHACSLAQKQIDEHHTKVINLRQAFIKVLREELVTFEFNNDISISIPHVLNIRIPNVSSETLVLGLGDVAISSGSACNSNSLEPSYVLTSIGLSEEEANNSIRICLSPDLTNEQIKTAVKILGKKIKNITQLQGEFV
ncbi:cysteine desulfurase family protein [Priestia aryabhattai]|uniref:cysteine desulfurase family protein n=1 Tax=Priestia aryabhattai TaxID=412384 RepID=UPI001ADAFCF8|nr:cysteine desulfurase family protein [Priestia aryabhattai]QTL52735.1 cysteine desulfurase [Priestia aryabhattai]